MDRYYWKCCDEEHDSGSLREARESLESHEKDNHKGKSVGSFGIQYNMPQKYIEDVKG